jgi:2-keto-4-pentenoate hydratase
MQSRSLRRTSCTAQWHLAPLVPQLPEDLEAHLAINGVVQASAKAEASYGELVHWIARLLEGVGERLTAGDRIITGSVVQAPVSRGDDVTAEFGALGYISLTIG